MLIVGSIVIRVHDLARHRTFWSSALDYVARDPEAYNDDGVVLTPRVGSGPNVTLDTMRSDLQIPPRIHLDLYASDQEREVARLKTLGASEVEWKNMPEGADFVIMADPEGNRFCVINKAGRMPADQGESA